MEYIKNRACPEHSRRGFTLIELLVVIAIIGILTSMILVTVGDFRKRARNASARMSLSSISGALAMCRAGGGYVLNPGNESSPKVIVNNPGVNAPLPAFNDQICARSSTNGNNILPDSKYPILSSTGWTYQGYQPPTTGDMDTVSLSVKCGDNKCGGDGSQTATVTQVGAQFAQAPVVPPDPQQVYLAGKTLIDNSEITTKGIKYCMDNNKPLNSPPGLTANPQTGNGGNVPVCDGAPVVYPTFAIVSGGAGWKYTLINPSSPWTVKLEDNYQMPSGNAFPYLCSSDVLPYLADYPSGCYFPDGEPQW